MKNQPSVQDIVPAAPYRDLSPACISRSKPWSGFFSSKGIPLRDTAAVRTACLCEIHPGPLTISCTAGVIPGMKEGLQVFCIMEYIGISRIMPGNRASVKGDSRVNRKLNTCLRKFRPLPGKSQGIPALISVSMNRMSAVFFYPDTPSGRLLLFSPFLPIFCAKQLLLIFPPVQEFLLPVPTGEA